MRADDNRKMLMGMAVLKSHDVNNTRYGPDGWLGQRLANNDGELVLPVEDSAFVDAFCSAREV